MPKFHLNLGAKDQRSLEDAENRMKEARKNMNRTVAAQIIPISAIDRAKAAWPIFGGTSPPAPAKTDPPKADPPQGNPPAAPAAAPAGGVTPPANTPGGEVNVAQLLAQLQTLTQQVTTLTTENEGYKTKETEAENAKKTKEQQLETTIAQKDQVIEQATNLIGQKALENALLTHKDYQFHDANDALMNLKDAEGVKVTVDIAKQIATVEGLDAAIKDLATRKSWMLSKGPETPPDPNAAPATTPPATRATGAPPAQPTTDAAKATQRANLRAKYTAIGNAPVTTR